MNYKNIKNVFLICFGALIFIIAGIYNGYPIFYSDSSTYLSSGFELETPFDRPITYGLFIRLTSLNGFSLWTTIFFQSLILSYLIFLLMRKVLKDFKNWNFILTIILLSLFTGVSWVCSMIMPDIFTPILLLSITLLALFEFRKIEKIFLYFIFLLSTSMHTSHIIFSIMTLVIVAVIMKVKKKTFSIKSIFIFLFLILISIFVMGSSLSKSKHVFLMGAFVEHGILKKYLNDKCADKQFKLCAYKDSLPNKAVDFVWDKKSPLYKIGGWKESKKEFNTIIWETFTEPKYILLHIKESIKATFEQLLKYNIGDGTGVFLSGTLLYERISNYLPREIIQYKNSKQNQANLPLYEILNKIYSAIIAIAVLLLIVFLILKKKMLDRYLINFLLFLFIGIIINAWTNGTFANAIDRLGCKMIWLLPFSIIIILFQLFMFKSKQS